MSRPALPAAISETGVLAILRGLSEPEAVARARSLSSIGVRAAEITLDSPGATDAITTLAGDGDALTVGAGTVRSRHDAERAIAAGATFLVAPDVQPELVAWTAEQGVPMLPGALTSTEVHAAWLAGAPAVKLFPAGTVGPGHLRALRAPLGDIPLVPTGGVTGDNASAWFAAGAHAIAVGGWLTEVADPDELTARGLALLTAARQRGQR